MLVSRRHFLAGAAGVTVAGLCPVLRSASDESESLPIIDTHQHLWDLSRFRLPWLKTAPEVLQRNYLIEDYLETTRDLGVVQAVYMEVDVDPEQQLDEAQYVLRLCRTPDVPTKSAVISGRPNSEGFAEYIGQFKENPMIKGVRQVLHVPSTPAGFCLQPTFVQSMKLLGELGKSFDLCMRPGELGDALRLVQTCPDTRFILDHCGNADPKAFFPAKEGKPAATHSVEAWRKDIGALARQPNVVCKISGIIARAPQDWNAETLAPIVTHCLDEFGPDRVIFGGDWPVCNLGATFRQWVTALKEIVSERPRDHQAKLFAGNARRLYGLS